MGEGMAQGGPLLLGRRTHEDFYGFWPKQRDNPFTKVLNNVRKYVASTTLEEPLPWSNSTLLKGDAAEAVARSGRRLFPDGAPFASLRLMDTVTTTTGVVIATYDAAEPAAEA